MGSSLLKQYLPLVFALALGLAAPMAAQDKARSDAERAGHGATKAAKTGTAKASNVLDNAAITAQVKTALITDKTAPASKINVNTDKGVVTLLGQVDSAAQKTQAEKVAKNVKGVKKVVNKLTVAKSSGAARAGAKPATAKK
jgi:hyperosmotically inducible periplasmic protein